MYRHLSSKYHWMSRKDFIKLSVGSAFSFSSIGPKRKRGIGGNFKDTSYPILNLLKYTRLVSNLG